MSQVVPLPGEPPPPSSSAPPPTHPEPKTQLPDNTNTDTGEDLVALGEALANSLIATGEVNPNFERRNSLPSRLAIGRSASTLSSSSPLAPIIAASPLLSSCPSIVLPLLAGILVDKVGRLAAIDTSLENLAAPEAMQIGRSLRMALDVSASMEDALSKWSNYYPSVDELLRTKPLLGRVIAAMARRMIDQRVHPKLFGRFELPRTPLEFVFDKDSDALMAFLGPHVGSASTLSDRAPLFLTLIGSYVWLVVVFGILPTGNALYGTESRAMWSLVWYPLIIATSCYGASCYVFSILGGHYVLYVFPNMPTNPQTPKPLTL